MLKDLQDGLLYAIVFGPGVGESIVLRIPPSSWVVVDGLLREDVSPAARLLRELDVEWSAVVLTHDHQDHGPGLASVLSHKGRGPVGCSRPFIAAWRAKRQSGDGKQLFDLGAAEDTLSKIDQRWLDDEDSEWDLKPRAERMIGGARLTALWPDEALLPEYAPGRENMFSTPLLVEWEGVRLLLGADLPADQWADVGKLFHDRELGNHALFKVAHHGSRRSVSREYAPPNHPERRTWVATAFTPQGLPRFENGEGVEQLLELVPELHLTAADYLPAGASLPPQSVRRATIRDASLPAARQKQIPGGVKLARRRKCAPEDLLTHHVIAVGFREDGTRADIRYGHGTLIVRN